MLGFVLVPLCVAVGGGFGIPYRPEQAPLDLEDLSHRLRAAYDVTIGTTAGLPPVRVVTECGRYVTGPHGYFF